MEVSTLRPGLLVGIKTSVVGNVSYVKRDLERDHLEGAALKARWETERTISDPEEHEAAAQARNKARSAISRICANSAFGLLCPEAAAAELKDAIAEARKIVEAFNSTAKLSRIRLYVIAGRIAPDDVEAVKAINSEVRGLLDEMKEGVTNLDAKQIREAANRARSIGQMLEPDAQVRVQMAIDAARSAARKIVKAGEQAAVEVDRTSVRKITEARMAFLDLDNEREVAVPTANARAIDLTPEKPVGTPNVPRRRLEV